MVQIRREGPLGESLHSSRIHICWLPAYEVYRPNSCETLESPYSPRIGILHHKTAPKQFNPAATKKYTPASPPFHRASAGNALALTNAPKFPTIFIAPETDPDRPPPMSMQYAQLGLIALAQLAVFSPIWPFRSAKA